MQTLLLNNQLTPVFKHKMTRRQLLHNKIVMKSDDVCGLSHDTSFHEFRINKPFYCCFIFESKRYYLDVQGFANNCENISSDNLIQQSSDLILSIRFSIKAFMIFLNVLLTFYYNFSLFIIVKIILAIPVSHFHFLRTYHTSRSHFCGQTYIAVKS